VNKSDISFVPTCIKIKRTIPLKPVFCGSDVDGGRFWPSQ